MYTFFDRFSPEKHKNGLFSILLRTLDSKQFRKAPQTLSECNGIISLRFGKIWQQA